MARSGPELGGIDRWVRVSVLAFLALFTACGLLGVEAWPLTGFQLFSHLRHDRIRGWEAVSFADGGGERPVDFTALGPPYRGGIGILRGFPALSAEERTAVCEAWLGAVRAEGVEASAGMRVYRTVWSLERTPRTPQTPSTQKDGVRKLVTECR